MTKTAPARRVAAVKQENLAPFRQRLEDGMNAFSKSPRSALDTGEVGRLDNPELRRRGGLDTLLAECGASPSRCEFAGAIVEFPRLRSGVVILLTPRGICFDAISMLDVQAMGCSANTAVVWLK